MGTVYSSVCQLIGRTPLVRMCRIEKELGLSARLLAKIEGMNPAGSAKDRVALTMIEEAERLGLLTPGATIIEPTSGNTGIGLAAVAAVRGYRVILVMPDTMSAERIKLLAAYGAQIVLSPGAEGMAGSIAMAEELARKTPGSWIPGQFDNPANPLAHYRTTGPELFEDADGQIDIFVCGVGTGGTLTGTGRYLKERLPDLKIVAVEPASSPLLSGGNAAPHGLQGIGANFIPGNLDRTLIDEVIPVTEADAYRAGRMLGRTEGILAGISAGAALAAATEVAARPENKDKTVAVLLPDHGDRYLSTPLFGEND